MIYRHCLTSKRILPRRRCSARRWTPINLLYVCHQIYDEAFRHLYTKGEFVFQVRPQIIFGIATPWGSVDSIPRIGLKLFLVSQKAINLIEHIVLQIRWPTIEYSIVMNRHSEHTMDVILKQTMATAGSTLSYLPALRTIDISWFQLKLGLPSVETAPPKYKVPRYLRGLKLVRWKNKKVCIRMPANGPISTEELAKAQEGENDFANHCKEMDEDCDESRGHLSQFFGWG